MAPGLALAASCRSKNLHITLREGRKRSALAEAMNHRGEGNPNTIEILPRGQGQRLQNNRKPLPQHWL